MFNLSDLNVAPEFLILPNGIKFINFKRKNFPISIKCLFAAGSRFDEIEGCAHFLEHLLVAGTKKFPTKDKLAAYIENYGGYFSANTSPETLSLNISISDTKDINIASKILKEMIFNPLFKENTIENERKSIIRELNDRRSNPEIMADDIFYRFIFHNTSLSNPIIGNDESIKNIKKLDIINFYKKYILSGQMVLVTSGDISIEIINKFFAPFLSKIEYSIKLPSNLLKIKHAQRINLNKSLTNNQIFLEYGFLTPSVFDKNNFTLNIISQVFNGSRSSFLIRRLRYEKGLVYGINHYSDKFSDCGTWSIQTSTAKENVQEIINIIKEELFKIINNGLSDKELGFIKNKIIKSAKLRLQTSESLTNFHAYRQLNNFKDAWILDDYFKGIESVNSNSIKKIAKDYLHPDKAFLSLYGNFPKNKIKL